jgi:HAD superfamily hydrolase (TIGR01509 family)
MLKAIVFDMDGVIIDSEPIHIEIDTEVMREFGGEPTVDEIYEFVGITNREMWETLRRRHNLNGTVEQILERHREYKMKRFSSEKIPPIDGIEDLIKDARKRGLKIALATSSPRYFAECILENAGLMQYFDALVTSDDVTRGKPDPEVYLKAAQRLDLEPGCCIAIEDGCFGIQSAKSAGMRVIAFRNPNSGDQDTSRADFVVSSIRSIHLDELMQEP